SENALQKDADVIACVKLLADLFLPRLGQYSHVHFSTSLSDPGATVHRGQ
ncbi:hypothetical protein BgiMline_033318, partial [Biomphalaria glabrata]